MYWIAPDLFALVFGESWRIAGEYARILVIASFFQFIFTPIDKGAQVVGATRYIIFWNVIRFTLLMMLLAYSMIADVSIEHVLYIIVIINIILYASDGVVEYFLSGKK